MPLFHKIFVPLFAALAFLPSPSFAALIPRNDLESLCYLSSDIVEATLDGYKSNPAAASGIATVSASLSGQYHPADEVAIGGLDLYTPARPGQHCILFITRSQFTFNVQPPKITEPRVIDMLFVDKYNRVQRYLQVSNPGGLLAEDYPLPGSNAFVTNEYTLDKDCPTLTQERSTIAAKRVELDQIQPLLSRFPRPQDIPALEVLWRERKQPSTLGMRNIVKEIASERLATLYMTSSEIVGSKGDIR